MDFKVSDRVFKVVQYNIGLYNPMRAMGGHGATGLPYCGDKLNTKILCHSWLRQYSGVFKSRSHPKPLRTKEVFVGINEFRGC